MSLQIHCTETTIRVPQKGVNNYEVDILGLLDYFTIYNTPQLATGLLRAIKSQNIVSITNIEIIFLLGYSYYKLGDFKQATMYFDRIADNCPNNFILQEIARIYGEIGHKHAHRLMERVKEGQARIAEAVFRIVFSDRFSSP